MGSESLKFMVGDLRLNPKPRDRFSDCMAMDRRTEAATRLEMQRAVVVSQRVLLADANHLRRWGRYFKGRASQSETLVKQSLEARQ